MKKGASPADIFLVLVILIIFGLLFVLGDTILFQFQTALTDQGLDTQNIETTRTGLQIFNEGILVVAVGIAIVGFILGLVLDNHPGFYMIAIFILALAIILSANFANMYETFIAQPFVSDVAPEWTFMTAVFANLPILMLVFGSTMLVGLVAKSRGGGGSVSGGF